MFRFMFFLIPVYAHTGVLRVLNAFSMSLPIGIFWGHRASALEKLIRVNRLRVSAGIS